MNDGIEIERDETSDECNTMLGVSESRMGKEGNCHKLNHNEVRGTTKMRIKSVLQLLVVNMTVLYTNMVR